MGKQLKGVAQKDLVGVISLENPDNVIVVRLNHWKGKDSLDLRLFWHPGDEAVGLFVPTKRGVSIPVDDAERFIQLCEKALDRFNGDCEEEVDGKAGS